MNGATTEALLDARLEFMRKKAELLRTEKFRLFKPYVPQHEFFSLGAFKRERLLMAGNQCGKTVAGAFEATCHLTGLYPDWWQGKRFNHPVTAWAGGETGELTRDKIQMELCGKPSDPSDYGNGLIPKDRLVGRTLAHGISDAYDSITVRHVSGGSSVLGFKSYVQGRSRWQSATLDFVWTDEEPPDDIYDEAKMRLTGPGISFTTCTPLKGPTQFIRLFWPAPHDPDKAVAKMGLRHVSHFTEEEKAKRIAGMSPRLRAARENGDPVLGAGAIFQTPMENLKVRFPEGPQLEYIAGGWKKLWGIDFGFGHPFAAALCAIDPDTEIFYVMRTLRQTGTIPLAHAAALKMIAANPPVAWPHDGTHTEKGTGEKLADVYKGKPCELKMMESHATHYGIGGYHVWPGLTEMDTAMMVGKFKVLDVCHEFFEEYATYHTKLTPSGESEIVKTDDDVLDAVRCAWMMRRKALAVPFGSKKLDPGPRNRAVPGADEQHWGY